MAIAMTTLALGLAAAGAATNAYGQIRQGREQRRLGEAQQRAAESEAGLLDYNAAIADLQARDVVERGREEESRFRTGVRSMIGAQRADIAASGVDVGFGSAVDVQADAAFLGELDALTIRTNAAREAWGYQVQAADIRERARITRKEGVELARAGREAQRGAKIGAIGGALLTGGSLLEARYGFAQRTA
jgi:hypothetical protein